MPEIDFKPDDYRVQTKRGRWMVRDDFRVGLPYAAIVCVGFLGFAWWNRAEIGLAFLFGTCAVASLALGIVIGSWLKRFD